MAANEPVPMAPEFRPFWAAVAEERLRFPYCPDCRRFHWYPMPRCPHCGGTAIEWHRVDGAATLFSWTVVRRPFSPEFAGKVPYIVALVTFADAPGVRLISNLSDIEPDELSIGMALVPHFPAAGDRPLVYFSPAPGARGSG